MTAPTLEEMIAVKRAAEALVRADFQRKWGDFTKCTGCGARLTDLPQPAVYLEALGACVVKTRCCEAPRVQSGYTPAPENDP